MNYASDIEAIARESGKSPLDVLEFWLERSSVREYCGGLSRDKAEAEAIVDVRRWFWRGSVKP